MNTNRSQYHSCNVIVVKNDTYVPVGRGWEGIPDGIAINLIICITLLIGWFLIQWRVHRLKDKQNWLHFIFGDKVMNKHEIKANRVSRKHRFAYLPPVLHQYDYALVNKIYESQSNFEDKQSLRTDSIPISMSSGKSSAKEVEKEFRDENQIQNINKTKQKQKPKRFWMYDYLFVRDITILRHRGSDALQYLLFQRYLIYFMTALTIICLVVILPTNLRGNSEPMNKPFGRTTINNLSGKPKLLWIHAVMACVIVIIGFYIMRQFSNVIQVTETQFDRKAILIQQIPKSKRKTEFLLQYFKENFPNIFIKKINFVYDIRELEDLKVQYLNAIKAKDYCHKYNKQYNCNCEVRPYCLGRFGGIFCCCSCCPKIDGLRFYAEEKADLERKIEKEIEKTLSDPKGSAFVKFKTIEMADEVHKHFKQKRIKCCNYCWVLFKSLTSFCRKDSDPLQTYKWKISYCPLPEDIEWRDIAIERQIQWLWNVLMHIILIFIFLFLSTPTVVVELFDSVVSETDFQSTGSVNSLVKYSTTLVLMLSTGILPGLVLIVMNLIPFTTKSALNHAIMSRVYIFLVMMVLVLPSLGLQSTGLLISNIMTSNRTHSSFEWKCVFPSESSAFFVNYVLAAGFVSNTMEIMRISELALYLLFSLIISRSVAELESARKKISFEFFFGSKYPRLLLMFTIITTFSISCPLIAPCGLFYMFIKHMVDRYCIQYIYIPSKINSDIHNSAVFFVYISLGCLLFQLSAFLVSRTGYSGPTILVQIALYALIIFISCQSCITSAISYFVKRFKFQ